MQDIPIEITIANEKGPNDVVLIYGSIVNSHLLTNATINEGTNTYSGLLQKEYPCSSRAHT